jgi:hypothetical protein
VGAHRGDEVVVDGRRDLVLVEVGLEGGVVATGAGEEHVELGLAAEGGGEGVLEALERAEQALHRVPAHPAVR